MFRSLFSDTSLGSQESTVMSSCTLLLQVKLDHMFAHCGIFLILFFWQLDLFFLYVPDQKKKKKRLYEPQSYQYSNGEGFNAFAFTSKGWSILLFFKLCKVNIWGRGCTDSAVRYRVSFSRGPYNLHFSPMHCKLVNWECQLYNQTLRNSSTLRLQT